MICSNGKPLTWNFSLETLLMLTLLKPNRSKTRHAGGLAIALAIALATASTARALQYAGGVSDPIVPFAADGATGVGPASPSDPMQRNDDDSYGMNLPFSFTLYGTNYNHIHINTNGNLSFGTYYSTFSPNGFPDSSHAMIAPFWADVDTQNATSGVVHYSTFDSRGGSSPNTLVVTWDHVGYYSTHVDKLNTFQVVITDGTNALLGSNNVSFSYGSMNWTTGDASGGSNGFGGTAATVGINKGDGAKYIQVGRFDNGGSLYNGQSAASGVHWLDNQNILFNASGGSINQPPDNLPPVAVGIPTGAINLVAGQHFHGVFNFIGPEVDQWVVIAGMDDLNGIRTDGMTISNVDGYLPGMGASSTLDWTPSESLIGRSYTVTYHFYDNLGLGAVSDAYFTVVITPEPASLGLLGVAALALLKRQRKS